MGALGERVAGFLPVIAEYMDHERKRLAGTATANLCARMNTARMIADSLAAGNPMSRMRTRRELAGEIGEIKAESWPIGAAELRAWFADSVMVDEDGNPRPFYHGTAFDFTTFDPDSLRRMHGADVHGFYFTRERQHAEKYGEIVITAYLRMANPKRLTSREAHKVSFIRGELRAEWEAQGFDGVVIDDAMGDEHVVFHPDQIRVIAREPA